MGGLGASPPDAVYTRILASRRYYPSPATFLPCYLIRGVYHHLGPYHLCRSLGIDLESLCPG
jgi:hypothetical protein